MQSPSPAELFDELAATYDQTGVPFFRPVGARLVEHVAPRAGERALDVGCGRGAVTVPLAGAVGPEGSVLAVDVSSAMVAATRDLVADARLHQVTVEVADAADLQGRGRYDVVTASLVLFFLPDPAAALTTWLSLLDDDGGRLGLTTFGELDEATQALEALLLRYAPPGLLDARTKGTQGPFASAAATRDLVRASGASEVEMSAEKVTLPFPDVAAWEQFSRTTMQRAMWANVPDAELDDLRRRAADILDRPLVWEVRFIVARR
jgi:O-methyltransferase/aklanonic acid methyltransferase